MKRLQSLGLVLALAVVLAGCGEKKEVQKAAAAAAIDPNVIVADETLAARLKVGTVARTR